MWAWKNKPAIIFSDEEMKVAGNRRTYPFVDIWMSRKSWPEVRIKILSA